MSVEQNGMIEWVNRKVKARCLSCGGSSVFGGAYVSTLDALWLRSCSLWRAVRAELGCP